MPEIRIEDINAGVLSSPASFCLAAEEEYEKRIDALAWRTVADEALRVVLIAGPSASGKTTTANLLADKIIGEGRGCVVISLDDFYLESSSPAYPRHPDGTLDYESVQALDLDLIADTLSDIAEGRAFSVPKFDFKLSRRGEGRRYPPLCGGIVIIEGLHALNPLISATLSDSEVLKIFISVSTNITREGQVLISGRKLRLLRRTVRDSIYRATGAERTLRLWRSVVAGEKKYLYPTRKYANVEFDTFHASELSIMRLFAEALITEGLADSDELMRTLLTAARAAETIPLDCLPDTSLLREFVPGGVYEDLY